MSKRFIYYGSFASVVIDYFTNLFGVPDAAYSLRKLSPNSVYAGAAIRVRRSSDNAEQDINFVNSDPDAGIDTSALLSFVGSGDGFVTTWYNQNGSGNNATNATAAQQPLIVASGVLYTENSKPVVRNPNANTVRRLVTPISTLQSLPLTAIFAGRVLQNPTNQFGGFHFPLAGTGSIGGGSRYELAAENENFAVQRRNSSGAAPLINTASFNTNPYIQQGIFRASQLEGRQNGVDATGVAYLGTEFGTASTFQLLGGGNIQSNLFADLASFEYIIYFSDKYDDRTAIETNINDYYNVF